MTDAQRTASAAAPRTAERGVHATWLYTLSSIIVFVVVLDALVLSRDLTAFVASRSTLDVVIVVLALASMVVQVRYCWFLRVGLGGGLPHPAWTTALFAASVPAWVLGLFSAEAWFLAPFPLWIGVVLVACVLPRRPRGFILAAGVVAMVCTYLIAPITSRGGAEIVSVGDAFALTLYAVFLPLAVMFSLWWWDIVVELDRHRRSAAELAIAKERLRFAADLHDIQGHHLQVIALKAELAERMLERDPDAALEQLRETRLIASEALQETRSLVAGYREVGLDDELRNAREVLSASGAVCDLRIDKLPTNADSRRALAFIVREATTNILRHSTASHVQISLNTTGGCSSLTIANDGADDAHPDASGTGISGLSARVAAQGGTLTTAGDGDRFGLSASIPDGASDVRSDDEENDHG